MTTKAVDSIPTQLHKPYLKAMKDRGLFWYEMTKLCLDFGMRNVEARELKADHIDLDNCVITLSDSKQVRAYVTKQANKQLDKQWLIEGRKLLRGLIGGELAPLLVRMATTTDQLEALAEEYEFLHQYTQARESYFKANIDTARATALKTAPKGRKIDFSGYPEAKRIILMRASKYKGLGGYLFPVCELAGNRAKAKGFEPVSRQSVYRVIKEVEAAIKSTSNKFREALKGVRLGLHSARKSAVQKVANTIDLMAASLWIGHASQAQTSAYLDRSERRINDITERLAQLNEGHR
ncbi:hypothetical protein [Vibrio alfacsensis]|uniref:hypothetical protein n=1 Tax=Vibrio alfacsensis TaxID=1074311 RepID=UPI0040685CD3